MIIKQGPIELVLLLLLSYINNVEDYNHPKQV